MGPQTQGLKAVLDTNVAVSALVLGHSVTSWLRHAWQRALVVPLVDEPCVRELMRVLGYPKFELDDDAVRKLLGDYLPYAQVVPPARRRTRLPICRDPDDQMFLELAARGNADVLVTGDKSLLDLGERTRFEIETPGDFRTRFASFQP